MERPSSLPQIPEHGFKEGDRVEMPMRGRGPISGTLKFIDVSVGRRVYRGLALLGDDNRYYEFHPQIAKKL